MSSFFPRIPISDRRTPSFQKKCAFARRIKFSHRTNPIFLQTNPITPLTCLALWVPNRVPLSHFWRFRIRSVAPLSQFWLFWVQIKAPLSHFWLLGFKVWHPSHRFGSFGLKLGLPSHTFWVVLSNLVQCRELAHFLFLKLHDFVRILSSRSSIESTTFTKVNCTEEGKQWCATDEGLFRPK